MPPNILIFMTDHQRADTAPPYNRADAPHLRRFAAQGLSFPQTYCPAPHCCPSRATFFTGLYPSGHGVWNNICNDQALSRGLKPGVRLWSEDLAQAGYDLRYAGKWHVSVEEGPAQRGWREHFVSGARGDHHGLDWEEFKTLAEQPVPPTRGEGEILRPGYGSYTLYGESAEPNRHDETTLVAALEALEQVSHGSDPWGLYVGLIAPHDPYEVQGKYLDRYPLDQIQLPETYPDRMRDKPAVYRRMREMTFDQLSEREIREGVRHYLAFCSSIDDQFGRLLAALERTGQADNTLVLFTSDHGDYCGDHGLFAKGIPCFNGAYQVPAVVRWPAALARPGQVENAFVSLADFGPTFLDAAGVAAERRFTGRSLLPFLRGETPAAWRDALFTQCNGVELYYTQRSVLTRDWRYTFNGFDQDELYDLRADPHETRNLANDPAYDLVKRAMCRRLWQFAHQEGDSATNPYITVGLAPWGPAEAFADSPDLA